LKFLAESYGKRNRTIINCYSSILETLERSPIGVYFGQGVVKREGRGRTVLKERSRSVVIGRDPTNKNNAQPVFGKYN